MAKRVKVKVEHRRKLFYERFLSAWREQSEDKNQKYVIYKGMHNLKQFPLEVNGISMLRQIGGIGETLAVRCDAAWDYACAKKNAYDLTLKEVKELNKTDYNNLLILTKNKNGKATFVPSKKSAMEYNQVTTSTPSVSNEHPPHDHAHLPDMTSNGTDASSSLSHAVQGSEIRYSLCEPIDEAEVFFLRHVHRNLQVCPGMSASRAQLVANLFPSLSSLNNFYSNYSGDKTGALHQSIPLINLALSAQISKFFTDQ